MTDKSDVSIASTPLPTRYWEAVAAKSVVFCESDASFWWDISPKDLLLVNSAEELSYEINRIKTDKELRNGIIEMQNGFAKGFSPFDDWKIESWFQ